jgi:hypothetical protein
MEIPKFSDSGTLFTARPFSSGCWKEYAGNPRRGKPFWSVLQEEILEESDFLLSSDGALSRWMQRRQRGLQQNRY